MPPSNSAEIDTPINSNKCGCFIEANVSICLVIDSIFCLIPIQDVVCVEAVKVDDLDASAVSANYDAAKSAAASATPGSQEEAEAMIDMEVNKTMGTALGLSLS